ncbi:MAG: hypothetical protein L3J23_05230 [Flavobacteriaceae bacterium]|nr:hypothetical protein [Flavobacteriaceae bacterium]
MYPKLKTIKITTLLLLVFSLSTIFAQDIITKKDGEKLKVIIEEVTKNSIKYVDFKDQNGVLFTIDKALISEVEFAHGKKLNIKNPEENPHYFADDKINNYMLNFSALGGNTLGLAYERVLKPGQSIMAEVKVYGVGIKSRFEDSRNGFGIDFSYRLKTKSLFSNNSHRPKHIFHGAYFAPVISFSSGKITYNDYFDGTSANNLISFKHNVFLFGIQYGKQWVLQKKVTVDASVGFHYYVGDDNLNDYEPLRLGNMIGSNNKLFGFNLRIGLLGGKSIVKKP